jgi:hypothetical protein
VFDESDGPSEAGVVMWRRILWVANGLTVQGGLELLTALALLLGATDSDTKPPAGLHEVVLLRVGPAILLVGGSLKAFAAVRNRRFRGRGIGLVALWSAVPTAIVWLCAPTGLALLAYGNIVYADRTSREAFACGDKGMCPEDVVGLLS